MDRYTRDLRTQLAVYVVDRDYHRSRSLLYTTDDGWSLATEERFFRVVAMLQCLSIRSMFNIALELRTHLGPKKSAILGIRVGLASVRKPAVLFQKRSDARNSPGEFHSLNVHSLTVRFARGLSTIASVGFGSNFDISFRLLAFSSSTSAWKADSPLAAVLPTSRLRLPQTLRTLGPWHLETRK